jgi:hypothetical protein
MVGMTYKPAIRFIISDPNALVIVSHMTVNVDNIPEYSVMADVVWEMLSKRIVNTVPTYLLSTQQILSSNVNSIIANSFIIDIIAQYSPKRITHTLSFKRLHTFGNKRLLVMNTLKRKS